MLRPINFLKTFVSVRRRGNRKAQYKIGPWIKGPFFVFVMIFGAVTHDMTCHWVAFIVCEARSLTTIYVMTETSWSKNNRK